MPNIILVDDEKMLLDSLSRYIQKELPDFNLCGCFYDGQEALDFLLQNTPHGIDVVLTDICMSPMDGLELAREICNRMPHCVVIILSGFSEFEYAQKAISYNVFHYMLKPIDYRELKKVLTEAAATAASRRQPPRFDLTEEAAEVFFVDLFFGSIFSLKDLRERFAALHFPFELDESEGCLVKLSLDEHSLDISLHYEIDRLVVSLKNALNFSIPDTCFYFMRKAAFDYYYVAVGSRLPDSRDIARLRNNIREFLSLECSVDLYHHFQSLKDLIQKKKPVPVPGAENSATNDNDALIQKAISYIEENYSQDLSRETVADAVYLSPSHFSFLFKQKTGLGFMDYLTNVRMQKAIELLKTHMRINDIAEKVGYQNRNRFTINFRQYTSYTPTEYRRDILSMEDTPDER